MVWLQRSPTAGLPQTPQPTVHASTPTTGSAARSRQWLTPGHAQATPPDQGQAVHTGHGRTIGTDQGPATPLGQSPSLGGGTNNATSSRAAAHTSDGHTAGTDQGPASPPDQGQRLTLATVAPLARIRHRPRSRPFAGCWHQQRHQITGKDWQRLTPRRQLGQHTDNRQRRQIKGNGSHWPRSGSAHGRGP